MRPWLGAALAGLLLLQTGVGAGCSSPCETSCAGVTCGDDGCGGSCGVCEEGRFCASGMCLCNPDCRLRDCGDDGCGGSCGACSDGFACTDIGTCACVPQCQGRECGDDGCWGQCGQCASGLTCLASHCCTPYCDGLQCGDDGCGGQCGQCPVGATCDAGQCAFCEPACAGRECGADGCGATCGECAPSDSCTDGRCGCSDPCDGIECGPGRCGGYCGACPIGQACTAGQCICPPQCAPALDGANACGDDGCGGSCGACGPTQTCTAGLCHSDCPTEVPPSPVGAVCSKAEDCGSDASCVDLCGWGSCTCDPSLPECPAWAPYCLPLAGDSDVSACMPACPTDGPCPGALSCLASWHGGAPVNLCRTGATFPCRDCSTESDCDLVGERCVATGGSSVCARPCPADKAPCEPGFACDESTPPGPLCLPKPGVCDDP